jgi:HEAT repeat protein
MTRSTSSRRLLRLALPALALAIAAGASAEALDRLDNPAVLEVGDEELSRDRLDALLGAAAVQTLRNVINDDSADPGMRLRAVRALGVYPTPESRDALHGVLSARGRCQGDGADVTGTPLLFVRAALESLAAIGDPTDVDWIVPCLQARSRDLRAAAARALRDLGASTAVCPLQRRRDAEAEPQVQSAISEALRRWPPQNCARVMSVRQLTDE